MKERLVGYLAVVVSIFLVATALPMPARADAGSTLNLTLKKTVVLGDWGNQKAVEWIYKVTNDADSANDYWFIYTEVQYKSGCFLALAHKPTFAEALWGPPHRPGNPVELAAVPGNLIQLVPTAFSISSAGASLSWSGGGWSLSWSGSEARSSNTYWAYDSYNQNLAFAPGCPGTSTFWGSIGSSVVFRVTQGAHIGILDQVEYLSSIWPFYPFPIWDDRGSSGWIYFDST